MTQAVTKAIEGITFGTVNPQPACESCSSSKVELASDQLRPRDESRDVWLPAFVLDEAITKADARTGRILPECNASYSRLGFRRYVPYSQLEAELGIRGADAQVHDYLVERLKVAQRDSELLDAICEAYDTKDIFPGPLADSIKNAVAERAKR